MCTVLPRQTNNQQCPGGLHTQVQGLVAQQEGNYLLYSVYISIFHSVADQLKKISLQKLKKLVKSYL